MCREGAGAGTDRERRLGGLAPGATAHLEASSPINCVIIAYIRSPRAGEANSGSEKTPLNTHSALQITITSSSTLFSHNIMVSFVNDSYIVRLLLILQTFKQPLGIPLLFVFVINFTYFPSNLWWSIINQEWVTIFSPNLGLLQPRLIRQPNLNITIYNIIFYLTSLLQHRLFKITLHVFHKRNKQVIFGNLKF